MKLNDEQRKEISFLYASGMYTYRGLAKDFGVSPRTISFIVDPKKLEENKKRRAERGGTKQYYNTDKNREYVNRYRKRKRNGELND